MLRRKNKKAAIEMSIGTIVIIVIAMVMLIMGVVLVRKIMCGGIVLSDKISSETISEINNLFGSDDFGIRCAGEIEPEVIGSGGTRPIACIINSEASEEFDIRLTDSKLTLGKVPGLIVTQNLNKIIVGSPGWKGLAKSGKTTIRVALLNIPRDIDKSNAELTFEIRRSGTLSETKTISIVLEPVGSFKGAIC